SCAYNLDIKPLPFGPERARALLAEAGFRPGADGIMEKDGKKLALSLKVPIEKESEAIKRVVLAFQNYLKNAGIAINVEFKEWQAWKEDVFLEHNFDIMFASWVFDDMMSKLCSRSEEHTSELQSRSDLVCRLLLEKKKKSKTEV